MVNIEMIKRAAEALHSYELKHGYISGEWRGYASENTYMEMATAALGAAEPFRDAHLVSGDD